MFPMKATYALVLVLLAGSAAGQSYYDENTSRRVETRSGSPSPIRPSESPMRRKEYLVDSNLGDDGDVILGGSGGPRSWDDGSPNSGARRAVTELEAGLGELKGYSVDMAAHIQKNGISGILEQPDTLTQRGKAIGTHIGGSIQGITTDMQRDMLKR
jgi:hypothetical protein